MQDITLVSVSWNNKTVMELMLKSFVKHHYKGEPLKLLLVDNGSDDGSKEWLKENKIPFYDFIINHGHEQSVNIVYTNIETKYVLLCDTDVEFLENVYDKYLPLLNEKCKVAGELITGDQLNAPVKPRIGAWFFMFDIEAMKEKGVHTFRDTTDWSYDVGSWMTEKIFEHGFTHHQIDRKKGNIDKDVLGMDYGSHIHFGKLSWNVANHMDREWEINMRMDYIRERLKDYDDIDLKGKFIV
ncbi:MAG: glycosyltransferase [Chitinophagaceae bacterium]|nr:glycosyltransferase [Chitinophagaceae bacterium]